MCLAKHRRHYSNRLNPHYRMRLIKRRNRHPIWLTGSVTRSKGLLSLTSTALQNARPSAPAVRSPSLVQVQTTVAGNHIQRAIVAGGEIGERALQPLSKRRRSQPRGAAVAGRLHRWSATYRQTSPRRRHHIQLIINLPVGAKFLILNVTGTSSIPHCFGSINFRISSLQSPPAQPAPSPPVARFCRAMRMEPAGSGRLINVQRHRALPPGGIIPCGPPSTSPGTSSRASATLSLPSVGCRYQPLPLAAL